MKIGRLYFYKRRPGFLVAYDPKPFVIQDWHLGLILGLIAANIAVWILAAL